DHADGEVDDVPLEGERLELIEQRERRLGRVERPDRLERVHGELPGSVPRAMGGMAEICRTPRAGRDGLRGPPGWAIVATKGSPISHPSPAARTEPDRTKAR